MTPYTILWLIYSDCALTAANYVSTQVSSLNLFTQRNSVTTNYKMNENIMKAQSPQEYSAIFLLKPNWYFYEKQNQISVIINWSKQHDGEWIMTELLFIGELVWNSHLSSLIRCFEAESLWRCDAALWVI